MGFPNKIRNSVRKILEELFSLFRYHQTAQLLPEKILKKQKRKKLLLLSESSSEADQSSIFIYISIQFFYSRFPFDYFMNQRPVTPVTQFSGDSKYTFPFNTAKEFRDLLGSITHTC